MISELPYHSAVVLPGLSDISLLEEDVAVVDEGGGEVRLQRHALLQVRQGELRLALGQVHGRSLVIRHVVLWIIIYMHIQQNRTNLLDYILHMLHTSHQHNVLHGILESIKQMYKKRKKQVTFSLPIAALY